MRTRAKQVLRTTYDKRGVEIFIPDHTPHWRVYDNAGRATISFVMGKPEGGEYWLSINATEQGEKSWKQTMITLDEAAARAVYEYIGARLGAKP